MPLSFNCTREEFDLIEKIVDKAKDDPACAHIRRRDLRMDLAACHASGTPLRLADLLAAPRLDFVHDVAGIYRLIDRSTGMLGECFLPRCAR